MKSRLLLSACFLAGGLRAADVQQFSFTDVTLPIERRVEDLIGRLTLDEKIAQTMMASPAVPRLGIPRYHWWNEALHGVARNGTATVFPQAIALAATWNPDLQHRIADAISTEVRAKNNEAVRAQGGDTAIYQGLTIWSPNVNIFRDPRWGRGQETYGEDPFLTAQIAGAFVRGLQGDDPAHLKTVATLKHFAVHSGPENARHRFNAVVSARDLRETYLPAFESGIREAHAWSLMSSYNAINGTPAPANALLLQKILRDEWGFAGAVVGDVDTVSDLFAPNGHHFSADAAEASAVAIKSGNDLCSGTTYKALDVALRRGLVTEADLDTALRRLFRVRFKLGQFDPPETFPYARIPISENDSPAHDELALEAARQSLVLLKNDGTLPWDVKTVKTLAVIGPTADDHAALLGNYSGFPARPVTLLAGLRNKLLPLGIRIIHERGAPLAKGFRETSQPFPADTLFASEKMDTKGLRRERFANTEFTAASSETTDEQVDFRWGSYAPIPDIPVTGAVLRWTGFIAAPTAGDYTLSVTVSGRARLFIDDQPVIDDWKPNAERMLNAVVPFTPGRPKRIRLDYAQTGSGGRISLAWQMPGHEKALERALDAARSADHVVLTLGITPDLEGEEMKVNVAGFDGGDRTSILLPASQCELLDRVAALGKPLTVVLTTGSALSFDTSKAGAILLAWYYGQRGGDAVAQAIFGDCNPAGRLPVTFYRSDADLPPFDSYAMAGRTYRYFTGRPLFAFGHGLSYTTFQYGAATLSMPTARQGDALTLKVPVTNTGARPGDEVVQVYARALHPPVAMPLQSLVGFVRVTIPAGETRSVTLGIKADQLRRWDEKSGRYVVDPGSYELLVGPASDRALRTLPLEILPAD